MAEIIFSLIDQGEWTRLGVVVAALGGIVGIMFKHVLGRYERERSDFEGRIQAYKELLKECGARVILLEENLLAEVRAQRRRNCDHDETPPADS